MSSVIWTLTLLTLASSGLCVIPTPVNLSISSRNYIHLLTWEPGPGSPDGLSYGVKVYSLGNATWLHVPGCEEVVSPLECNLTDVMPDLRDQYFINVTANLGIQSSTPGSLGAFMPWDDTILDPPLLSVSFCGHTLCVGLRSPSGWLQQVYSSLIYTLMVNNSKDEAQYSLSTQGLGGEKIKHVDPGRKYCVTATIADRKADRKSASSQCVESTVLYSPDLEISLALIVLMITFLAVIFYLRYTECICKRSTFPEILILLKSQDVQVLLLDYNKEAYSLVHVEAWTTAPPTTGGQEQGSSRNSICEEDEEAEPTGDAGYERRPGTANHISCSGGSSSDNPPPAAGHVLPSESRRDVSQTGTDSQDSSGCVGDDGPLSSSLSGEGPLSLAREGPLSLTGEGPLSLPLTREGPLSLPLTGEGPLSLPLTGEGPLSLPLTGEGPLSLAREGPLSLPLTGEGPLSLPLTGEGPLSLAREGPLSLSVAKNELWPLSLTAVGVRPASVDGGVQADEDGSGLNVNLLSVMLARHEEEEQDKEEEDHNRPCVQTDNGYERRPFLLGVSSVAPPVLPMSAAVTEPSHTQACTIYSQEDEEDDDEEDDDDDEEFSGYMRNFLITS